MENSWEVAMIKIRKAKKGDIPELEDLFLITRRHTFHWENPDKFKLEDFKQSTPGETIFVAEDENTVIIGFVSVWEQDAIPFIHHLFVAPSHQRKGVGGRLLQSLLTRLPLPYQLKCLVRNRAALQFYHKHGWVEIGQGTSEEGEWFLLELPSGKDLNPPGSFGAAQPED